MDITGEITGKGCLLIGIKDAIRLGGTLIMLPAAELEEVIDRELALLLKKGVTQKEVDLARTRFEAVFVRGLRRVGGCSAEADRLKRDHRHSGTPGYLRRDLYRPPHATCNTSNA